MMKIQTALGLLLGATALASAQDVTTINSARTFREFTGDAGAVFNEVNNYPSLISFSEQSVDGDGTAGGANRDTWKFSADSGATDFRFGNDTFFDVSMDVTLTLPSGTGNSPRKEGGFLFDTAGGQGLFILTSDGEVAAFGGPLPFFRATGTYTPGTTVTLGMSYFLDPIDDRRKIIYRFGNESSAPLLFDNLEGGIINNSTLGGYSQIPVDATNQAHGLTATFANIGITPAAPVPEPASMAVLGLGALALIRRRRASK